MDSGVRTVILHLTPGALVSSSTGRGSRSREARPGTPAHPGPCRGPHQERGLVLSSGGLLRKLATPVREATAPGPALPATRPGRGPLSLVDTAGQVYTVERGVSVAGVVLPHSALVRAGAGAGAPGHTWTFQRPPETTPPCFLEAISLTSPRGSHSRLWPPDCRGGRAQLAWRGHLRGALGRRLAPPASRHGSRQPLPRCLLNALVWGAW